jgi:hypothetical protein
MDWRAVHVGFDNDGLTLGGIVIWEQHWRPAGVPPVELPHPAHPHQRHSFDIYTVGDPATPIRFAAGELSNGVWGFYLPA